MAEKSSWGCQAITAEVGVPEIDKAAISGARKIRGGAIVMSMLGTEAPATGLPKGAFFNNVTRSVVVALEAIWEGEVSSPSSLAKYCTTL